MKEKIEKFKNSIRNTIENIKLKLSIIKYKITLRLSQITPIKLFSFMGIDFTASYSWFIGIAVISYLIYKNLFLVLYPKYPPIILTASSIISALMLYLSIALHELAHSIVARKYQVEVREIRMFLLGGIAILDRELSTPKAEFKTAVAGPLLSIALGLLFLIIGNAIPEKSPLTGIIIYTAFANLVIAVFNLTPAFPLDGGRMLRSLLWRKYDLVKATKIVANLGKAFGIFLILVSAYYIAKGYYIKPIIGSLLGVYITIMSRVALQNTLISHALSIIKVKEIMVPTKQLGQEPSIIISPTKNTNKEVFKIIGMMLAEKINVENFFVKENDTLLDAFIKFNKFPMIENLIVIDEKNNKVGIILREVLEKVKEIKLKEIKLKEKLKIS
ncbi:MAG: site-2 protease family protein [Sulfurihydrogenibium sp.]|jgi:Zn-dependent protease|nr:site-2 protease family protein [Sulfurihydrogenibium sp.]